LTFLSNNINPGEDTFIDPHVDIFSHRLDAKFTLEILLVYLLNMDKNNIDIFKEICERLVNYINSVYNNNNYFYFNNTVLRTIYNIPSNGELIFKKNDETNIANIAYFIDIENTLLDNPKKLVFFLVFKNYHLIRLAKMLIKVYFEKKYNNLTPVLNLMKEIIQNQLNMYTVPSEKVTSSNVSKNADSLTKGEETKEDSVQNKPLLTIRGISKVIHLCVKKYLIKSLKHCLYLLLESMSGNINSITNSQMFLEILNYFMSISMVLISCEECWEIKYKGVELLYQVIRKFANIKDTRLDDNSLLIQQYEAQINSCLKIIFTNTFNILSLFKGMKLLYQYITIPITTDNNYLKKAGGFVDINIKSNTQALPSFSEKYDHLLICKRLNFYSKLYLTGIKNKNFDTVSVEKSEIYTKEIYFENLQGVDIINEFFVNNYEIFFNNLFNMLEDFFVVLTYDRKAARNYKDFHFIQNGDGISFSHEKVMKYSLDYLKIISLIVNDKKFLNLLKSTYKIDNIICLIFYHINFLAIRRLQPVDTDKISYTVYSDEDVTEKLKEKISFNCLLTNDLLGILVNLFSSNVVTITKATFFELLKSTINLFTLSIDDIDVKLFHIVDLLINKFYPQIESAEGFKSPEEKVYISNHISKIVYYYFTKKLNSLDNELNEYGLTIVLRQVDIISANLINMILLKDGFREEEFDEMFYFNVSMIYTIFKKVNNPVMSKQCAAKLFIVLTSIEDIKLFNEVYDIHTNTLLELKQFDKFFILFFMILQYLTKKNNENKCADIIEETTGKLYGLIIKYLMNKQSDIFAFIIKSLSLASASNFDHIFRTIFENLLVKLLENEMLTNVFIFEEFQNIILTFGLTTDDQEKRMCLNTLITYTVNNIAIALNMDIMKVAIFILKLWSKDMETIPSVASNLDANLAASISHLIQVQQTNLSKQAAVKEEVKVPEKVIVTATETPSGVQEEVKKDQTSGQEQRSMPKLKALKFGK
jgi:hypothetical protein